MARVSCQSEYAVISPSTTSGEQGTIWHSGRTDCTAAGAKSAPRLALNSLHQSASKMSMLNSHMPHNGAST